MTRKRPAAGSTRFAPFVGFVEFDPSSQRWLTYTETDPKRPASAVIMPDDIHSSRRTIILTTEEAVTGTINPRPHRLEQPVRVAIDPSSPRLGMGREPVKRYGRALGNMGDIYGEIASQFPTEAPGLLCSLQYQLVMACEEARYREATNADSRWHDMDDLVKRGRSRLEKAFSRPNR